MNETEFDRFADEYHILHAKNVNITGESLDYFVRYKIRDICNQISKTRRRLIPLHPGTQNVVAASTSSC